MVVGTVGLLHQGCGRSPNAGDDSEPIVRLGDPPSPRLEHDPAWSPDGSRLAFSALDTTVVGHPYRIAVWTLGTGQTRTIADGTDPTWSADGQQIAFVRDDGLFIATLNSDRLVHALAMSGIYEPAWAPDGARIAFVVGPNGAHGASTLPTGLWIYHVSDGSVRLLSDRGVLSPTWHPSSEDLFCIRPRTAGPAGYEIVRVDGQSGAITPLSLGFADSRSPSLDGDGLSLAWHQPESPTSPAGVYWTPLSDPEPRLLLAGGTQPSWCPGVPLVACVVRDSARASYRLWLVPFPSGTPTRVTHP